MRIPGTHNYQIDSRQQSYRFFDRAFHLEASDKEDADTDTEVQTYADLAVGVPPNNLTIVALARQRAQLDSSRSSAAGRCAMGGEAAAATARGGAICSSYGDPCVAAD